MAACGQTYNQSLGNEWNRWAMVCPVYVQNTVTGKWRAPQKVPFYNAKCKTTNELMAFSSDATTLVIAAIHYPFFSKSRNARQFVEAKVYVRNAAGGYATQTILRQGKALPRGRGAGILSVAVSLSADGNHLALGIPQLNDAAGGACVYSRSNGEWLQPCTILQGSEAENSRSGSGVAISGNGQVLAVASFVGAGTVWIFRRTGATWSQTDKLTGSDDWQFGTLDGAVALNFDGNTLAFGGAAYNMRGDTCSILVFRNVNSVWLPKEVFGKGTFNNYFFGNHIDLSNSGRTMVVATTSPTRPVVFFFQNSTWVQDGDDSLKHSPVDGVYGTYPVAISGDGATIGVTRFSAGDVAIFKGLNL